MKKLTAIVLTLVCISTARTAVIDLTPGGFNPGNPPKVFTDWLNHHFQYDAIHLANEYLVGGWDESLMGPPFFVSTPLNFSTTTLSWNLSIILSPLINRWIFVGGPDPNNIGWINMYLVTGNDMRSGAALLTINNNYPVTVISVSGLAENPSRPQAIRPTSELLRDFLKEIRLGSANALQ